MIRTVNWLGNQLWGPIARTMGPLLTDQADDPAAQIEVLKYCYVTTKLADQTDKNLDALLKTQADAFLQNPTFVDLRPGR